MKFKIEAYIGIGKDRYVLTKSKEWRQTVKDFLRNDFPSPQDMLFDDILDLGSYILALGDNIKIGGKAYAVNRREGSIMEMQNEALLRPIAYRTEKPRRFNEKEVEHAILHGNNSVNNTLILDLEGRVKLIPFNAFAASDQARIAVRNEAFIAGNNYVGENALKLNGFISGQYMLLLEGWVTHLCTGELNIFQDRLALKKSEKQLWEEAEYCTRHLK